VAGVYGEAIDVTDPEVCPELVADFPVDSSSSLRSNP
jgi:hypothetical protein